MKVFQILNFSFLTVTLAYFGYTKFIQKTVQVNSIHDITPKFAMLNMQGKNFTTKNGKGSSGNIDINKQGDVLVIIEKQIIGTEEQKGGNNIFYNGVVFGLTEHPGKDNFRGVEKIGIYNTSVNQKTGHFIVTFSQNKTLKNGNNTSWYITDGNKNVVAKIEFNKIINQKSLQEVSGIVNTKKLGQLVYTYNDAKAIGFEK